MKIKNNWNRKIFLSITDLAITSLNADGSSGYPNDVVIKKFKSITGIEHRRYAEDHLNSSDLAFMAAKKQ
jgi:hypothetical protein